MKTTTLTTLLAGLLLALACGAQAQSPQDESRSRRWGAPSPAAQIMEPSQAAPTAPSWGAPPHALTSTIGARSAVQTMAAANDRVNACFLQL